MLTLELFKQIPNGDVFAMGVLPDSPDGINMSGSGKLLRWIAKKGDSGLDWAIYCHWKTKISWDYEMEFIRTSGDKVHDTQNILACVNCDTKVLDLYRH
jgi:hypothetical protein